MTPAARFNAAIELVDRILAGELADRALAGWGRQNRYAGSKDRAAIADLVYDALRRKRSLSARGGGSDGRAIFLGLIRDLQQDPHATFGAGPYAPVPLTDAEQTSGRAPLPDSAESADIPDWLWPELEASLGDLLRPVASALQRRAPVHVRVNLAKISRDAAVARLLSEGITSQPHALSPSALEVTDGTRKIRHAHSYLEGLVELQDVSSQAVADMVPLKAGETLLDYCAGGGGKTLAVAGRVRAKFYAHDYAPARMKDLPARAERAGVPVSRLLPEDLSPSRRFDTVLIDAPCSGSGSWRRDPQGKWALSREKLDDLLTTQRDILRHAHSFVKPGGHLVYATCSLLSCENTQQIDDFQNTHQEFTLIAQQSFTPLQGGDGFYAAVLKRD
ncbi:MAG: RsmB/NOP family class I SAM-dependent RNA methyltransferase [Paracoccaceae bacterium]